MAAMQISQVVTISPYGEVFFSLLVHFDMFLLLFFVDLGYNIHIQQISGIINSISWRLLYFQIENVLYYDFLRDKVKSLSKFWCHSQCSDGKWRCIAILRENVSLAWWWLWRIISEKTNQCHVLHYKPINALFGRYYALIVLLWEVHSYRSGTMLPKATLWEHMYPQNKALIGNLVFNVTAFLIG